MSNLFNMDNAFFRALGKLADLMILNILFIIFSLPIVTIGASWTAMYYVTLKLAENEEGYIIRSFWKSFKQNFKQATVIWLIMLLIGIILVLDLLIMRNASGTVTDVFRIIITATMIVYFIVLTYVFPVLARFYNSIRGTVKNAFIIAVANLPRTIAIAAVSIGAVLVTFLNTYTIWYGLLVWILAGFALVAYANSYFFKKIFSKYMPQETEEEENPDDWDLDKIGRTELDVGPTTESDANDADRTSDEHKINTNEDTDSNTQY